MNGFIATRKTLLLFSVSTFITGTASLAATPSQLATPFAGIFLQNFGALPQAVKLARKVFQRTRHNAAEDLVLDSVQDAPELGTSVARFQHFFRGLPVLGSQALYQPENGFWRDRTRAIALSVEPVLSKNDAIHLAQFHTPEGGPALELPRLQISTRGGEAKLVYTVELEQAQIWIDAKTGAKLAELATHLSADDPRWAPINYASIRTYNAKNRSVVLYPKNPEKGRTSDYWVSDLSQLNATAKELTSAELGAILQGKNADYNALCQWANGQTGGYIRLNHENCDLAFDSQRFIENKSDPATERASLNANAILAYYRKRFHRESYDGKTSPLISVVNVGYRMNNAYWDARGSRLVYGSGDGAQYQDFTRGVDVAGHEFTHAIIDQTAKLLPFDESGALNESYADFFGEWIEASQKGVQPDWVFAASVLKAANPSQIDGMRSLSNPHSIRNNPSHVSEKRRVDAQELCDRSNDQCFVHANSTIPSHAAYLMNRAIGPEKTQNLIYRTLTLGLTQDETFESAALATAQMCGTLYDATTCDRVVQSYQQVGLLQTPLMRAIAMN